MTELLERQASDRRHFGQTRIHAMMESRNQTLRLYAALATHRPYNKTPQLQDELHRFCQALIDYTASAHFQLYHKVAEGQEHRVAANQVAEQIYPAIAQSTDLFLEFNDRYGEDQEQDYQQLENRLSTLGERLASRIELEDKMLTALQQDRRAH